MNNAHNVVDILAVYENTGVARVGKDGGNLLLGGFRGYRLEFNTGRQNTLHVAVGKFQGIVQKLALLLVNTALLGNLLYQKQKLILGQGAAFTVLKDKGK